MVTATGNSDTHHLDHNIGGYPRNYVKVQEDRPKLDRQGVPRAVKGHHVFFTTGPFVVAEGRRRASATWRRRAAKAPPRSRCARRRGSRVERLPCTSTGRGEALDGPTATAPVRLHEKLRLVRRATAGSWCASTATAAGARGRRPQAFTAAVRADQPGVPGRRRQRQVPHRLAARASTLELASDPSRPPSDPRDRLQVSRERLPSWSPGNSGYVRRESRASIGLCWPHVGFLRGVACLDVFAGYAPQKARKRRAAPDQRREVLAARVPGFRSPEVVQESQFNVKA